MDKIIEKTISNLAKNNIQGIYAETKEDALNITETLLEENSVISAGGSMTLSECKITDLLKSGKYNFLDRSIPGISPEEVRDIYIKTFDADSFLGSANAITEDGYIYQVDGTGNRVSAMIFGPKQVIIVAGKNKIVKNADEAIKRVKEIAAPLNAKRLNCETYCSKTGKCISLNSENTEIPNGCSSESRICADYVFFGRQRIKNRIKVIIVNESLGY